MKNSNSNNNNNNNNNIELNVIYQLNNINTIIVE